MLVAVLTACVPTAQEAREPIDQTVYAARALPVDGTAATVSLLGDPSFASDHLAGSARIWYQRILEHVDQDAEILELAARDCIYEYGRTLHRYVQSVLVVFRLTGDLRLLDHVDEIAQVMRGELRDGWRGTIDGTDGMQDGYLNWVRSRDTLGEHVGKDTWQTDDMATHALVASIAYALHVNRDQVSPRGADYGANADFWLDYLLNHFEAKWRDREGVASGFPIMMRPHTASYVRWMKWHYYMGLLTEDAAYMVEALRMADVLWSSTEIRPVETRIGPAYVWPRSVMKLGGSGDYLMPITYAGVVFGHTVEFHLEGFHYWAEQAEVERFARTLSELIMDTDDPLQNGLASDVGGGIPRANLPSDPSWSRMSAPNAADRSFLWIAAWDRTGSVRALAEALVDRPSIHVAVGAFVDEWMHDAALRQSRSDALVISRNW